MSDEAKLQKQLEDALAKSDVKVAGDAADKMKENILKARDGMPWLGVGVHTVTITNVELTQAKTGTLGVKFTVTNSEGKNEVTKWLSEGALPYTIENLSAIAVHNAPEDKKADIRNAMTNVNGAKQVYDIAKAKFVGYQCWLSVKESTTQTYTDKNGVERPSQEKNILSYQPKETPAQYAAKVEDGSNPVDLSALPF